MKDISIPALFCTSLLSAVPLLIAGSVVSKAGATPNRPPPNEFMEIQWTYDYHDGFLMCDSDQSAGGSPTPEQRFRATAPREITSIGSCEVNANLVSAATFDANYIGCGGYDSAAFGYCCVTWRGSCINSYPGQLWLSRVVITSDTPIWSPVYNGITSDN
jgi:hypothetical protein